MRDDESGEGPKADDDKLDDVRLKPDATTDIQPTPAATTENDPTPDATSEQTASPAAAMPHARLAALIEVVVCSGFPTQIAIAGVLALGGMRPLDQAGRLSAPYVFSLSLADAAALVALVVVFLRLHGEKPLDVLLGSRPLVLESLRGVLHVPVLFLLAGAVVALVRQAAPWMHNVASNPMEGLAGSGANAILFVVVAVVGGGLKEEVQRAFVLHRFEQHLGGAWVGLVVFSLVFGLGHVIQGRDVAVATAILGLFWGLVYLRRRSIASAVVSHSCFNVIEIAWFVGRSF